MQKAIELLKNVLSHEVKSSVFYKKAAEITKDDESRMLFLELCSEEDDHARHLIEKMNDSPLFGDFNAKEYLKELESNMENSVSVEELQTLKTGNMKDVMDLVIFVEEKAYENYKNLADHAEDADIKSLCLKLAEEEKKHLNSATRMLESIDMDEEDRPAL